MRRNSICPGCGGGVAGARIELLADGKVYPLEELRVCSPCLDRLVFKLDDLKSAIKEIVS